MLLIVDIFFAPIHNRDIFFAPESTSLFLFFIIKLKTKEPFTFFASFVNCLIFYLFLKKLSPKQILNKSLNQNTLEKEAIFSSLIIVFGESV